MYAAVFTVSLNIVYWIFYVFVLYGSHGLSKQDLSALRHDYREFLAWPLLIMIILSAVAGWFLAKRAMSGVIQLTRTASAVAEGALSKRVPVKGRRDEIDRLAETFNVMLEKINTLIQGMRETNDNIAHDLRSPITRMRGLAEAALTGKAADEDAAMFAGHIIEECDRLLGIINTMLDISEAEAGVMRLNVEQVNITSLIHDAVDLFHPVAESKQMRIEVRTSDEILAHTDKRRLQRALSNLLDNALKYGSHGGRIYVSCDKKHDSIIIQISDNGVGISEPDLPHIFERFFRAQKSRTEPGNGLGLSQTRAFIKSLGGSVLVDSTVGKGSTFTIHLPYKS